MSVKFILMRGSFWRSYQAVTASIQRGDIIQAMASGLTVEEIVPLVEALAPLERSRLLRLITKIPNDDATMYELIPPARDEFFVKEDPLAWDGEGWEKIP